VPVPGKHRGVPGTANSLPGVDTVIYMMGINDIIGKGAINSVKTYNDTVKSIIDGCHASKKKIYIGTIPPAGGFTAFDKDPEKDTLRKDINKHLDTPDKWRRWRNRL